MLFDGPEFTSNECMGEGYHRGAASSILKVWVRSEGRLFDMVCFYRLHACGTEVALTYGY